MKKRNGKEKKREEREEKSNSVENLSFYFYSPSDSKCDSSPRPTLFAPLPQQCTLAPTLSSWVRKNEKNWVTAYMHVFARGYFSKWLQVTGYMHTLLEVVLCMHLLTWNLNDKAG